MSTQDFADLQLFITGPTFIRPEIREAGLLPEFGHRDSENNKRFGPAMAGLKQLAAGAAGTVECAARGVVLVKGSRSCRMEAYSKALLENLSAADAADGRRA